MKSLKLLLSVAMVAAFTILTNAQTGAIRINQLGYYPAANKFAIVANSNATTFELVNAADSIVEFSGDMGQRTYWKDATDSVKLCNFSDFTKPGNYFIRIPGFGDSYIFSISDTILRKAAYASLKSFYYQRSSYELTTPYAGIWARKAGHPDTQCILHSSTGKSGKIASPGGWYDAGDYGKYVINAGISVATLLSFYENFNNFFEDASIHIPESGNGQNDLLDEVKFELDWLKTMQDDDGGVFFKLTTLAFSGFVMPDADKADRYVIGKTTASALDFAAMMAMAGRIYTSYDSVYAADCVTRAENAWTWAKAHPAIYFKNPSDVSTGEYGDKNVSDEFIWAAAELFITTKGDEYKTYLEGKSGSLKYQNAPGWPSVQPLAALSLATRENGLSESLLTTIRNSVTSTASNWLNQIAASPSRIPQFSFGWGSNSQIANQGVGMLYAYLITKDEKYIKGAAECADYLLGKNATGYSFESAYGYKTPMNFHHRPSYADGVVQPIPGFVSGGPNPGQEDGQKYPFDAPAKSFVDVMGSYASNEVCINWNSPMTALFAGVDAILGSGEPVSFEIQTSINNPPTVNLTTPAYDSKIGSDQVLSVKGNASDPDGISKVELYIDSRYFATTNSAQFDFKIDSLAFGKHTATILAYDTKGLTTEKTNRFSNYAVYAIPGHIEAENYYNMSGISTQTTTDEGAGQNVSSLDINDWVDYSLNVDKTGTYRVEFRVAAGSGTKTFELRKATAAVITSQTFDATGGMQKWTTIADTIELKAGKQTVRLQSLASGWNLNWLNFEYLYSTSAENLKSATSENTLQVFPNPVRNSFNVKYSLKGKTPAEFCIFNHAGKLIEKKTVQMTASSSGEIQWTPKNRLSSGEYILIINQDGEKQATGKFVKTR